MKHNLKTKIFKILSLFPNQLGYFIYHFLQNNVSKSSFEYKIQSTKHSYFTINNILQKNKISINGLKIAELGSGWLPILPYQLLLEGGATHLDTYDINEHYNSKSIEKLNDYYSSQYNFEIEKKGKYKLHKGVSYFPNTNICNSNLEEIDLLVSRYVLEHVSPKDIEEMHNYFNENLKSGSFILHLISPSDHRAYSDSSLSMQDFLQYSEAEWGSIQTKFDYHNRLRLPQYLELLKKDFEIVYFEHDSIKINSEVYRKFKKLEIHNDFSKYNEQELMAGSVNILLKKL